MLWIGHTDSMEHLKGKQHKQIAELIMGAVLHENELQEGSGRLLRPQLQSNELVLSLL